LSEKRDHRFVAIRGAKIVGRVSVACRKFKPLVPPERR
jgi:hypothetical protein